MIIEALKRIEISILKINEQRITNLTKDLECEEYFGLNFQINQFKIKFRKAKITPKKVGQFVTLWKRNTEKQTEPCHVNDNFDFYIIVTELEDKFGFFIFPKHILSEWKILTNKQIEGKRGFRVYSDWTIVENKQAKKSQSWQTKYFIDLTNNELKSIDKFNWIMNAN